MSVPPVTVSKRRWVHAAMGMVGLLVALWWWRGEDDARSAHARGTMAAEDASDGSSGGGRWTDRPWLRNRTHPRGPGVSRPRPGLMRVSGAVVDVGAGTPVAEVEVVYANGLSEASTISDQRGRYTIDVPPGSYRPFVRADGILSVGRVAMERLPGRPRAEQIAASRIEMAPALAVHRDLAGVDLEVVRSGIVHGRVFDRAGRPVAGAIVRAMSQERDTLRPVLGTDLAETDLDGTFQLELASATYFLDAFHDRYGAVEFHPSVEVEVGERHEVDLTMIAGCVVSGRVVHAGGEPAGEGAIERAWSPDDPDTFVPIGDFDDVGEFRWSTSEEGDVVLRAWPWKATHSEAKRFACRDGARFEQVVFEIPRIEADLGGRIVTASGAPAPFAFLDVQGLTAGTMNQQERADEAGRWEVFSLPDGEYQITAYVDGQGATTAKLTVPNRNHTLRLSGSGALIGRVQGITDGSFVIAMESCRHGDTFMAAHGSRVVAVSGGGFRVDGLPACELGIIASTSARQHRANVTISASGVTTMDFDFRPPEPKTVNGSVRTTDGAPAVAADVSVVRVTPGGANSVDHTETDSSGRFTVTAHGGELLVVTYGASSTEVAISDDDDNPRTVELVMETETENEWSHE